MALFVGILVAVTIALLVVVRWRLFVAPLPQLEGEREVPGLSAPVNILRDHRGVPHITATTVEDAHFAQGFVHAQDRGWQLELNRRVCAGRLSELFGRKALEADRFIRRLGLWRAAQAELPTLTEEERRSLEAYARGVNAGWQAARRLPIELQLLKVSPEPWEPLHTLALGKLMALNLGANFESELLRSRIIARLGEERAAQFELGYPEGLPVTTPSGAVFTGLAREMARRYGELKPYLSMGARGASNAWVVSGKRTATGNPLLASDPHLALTLPSTWYEVHLVAPDVDVYGVSLPGAPGVVIGRTRSAAWGVTNSFADVQDLYLERFHPENPNLCARDDEWYEVERHPERIRVRGEPDVVEEVRVTRHGPVLIDGAVGEPSLSLCWVSLRPSSSMGAVLALNRAKSAREIHEALRTWHSPSQNFVFADAGGDIGYLLAGDIPIRSVGTGLVPTPGWRSDTDWRGYIPFEELPQLWNPESGIIVTANQAAVDGHYPYHVSADWMNGYRAARIGQVLEHADRVSFELCQSLQLDCFSAPGKAFARRCESLTASNEREAQALSLLVGWDGVASADSGGAAVYEVMVLETLRLAVEPSLGEELYRDFIGRPVHPVVSASLVAGRYTSWLLDALSRNDASLLPDSLRAEGWDGVLSRALRNAVAILQTRLGRHPASWRWGALHRVRIQHAFVKSAGRFWRLLLPAGEAEMGGDTDTPLQTAQLPHLPYDAEAWGPSWRQVVELGVNGRSASILAGGQSGHPASQHWLDQFPEWCRGVLHPHRLAPADVESAASARLRLRPASDA